MLWDFCHLHQDAEAWTVSWKSWIVKLAELRGMWLVQILMTGSALWPDC